MENKQFFDDGLLLHSELAVRLYRSVQGLPIVDYHSHLSEQEIAADKTFSTITEFWLKADHYKWRAMRQCGVAEKYVTGDASDYEKFLAYAAVMPKLAGNPLYYWTHMELKTIFHINEPLNEESAPEIYCRANKVLETLSVRQLLDKFGVEYIATTDDPVSKLAHHGVYGKTKVCPTFRADRAVLLDEGYLKELETASGEKVDSLAGYRRALEARLQYFISKGCTVADQSVEIIPDCIVGEGEAAVLFENRNFLTEAERKRFYCYAMAYLGGLYQKYNIVWQLHIGALRNINKPMFRTLGADTGYDVMHGSIDTDAVAVFLNALYSDGKLPKTVLYTLNASALPALCTIAGCFPNVRIGAAWWFNDTLYGIKSHLRTLSEYGVLGMSPGMLTDSRSFSSYCRFDFFRRILADFVAELVEKGEYDASAAAQLMYDICYANPKAFLNL